MIWSLIKSLFWIVIRLLMPNAGTKKKIRKLKGTVDELTAEKTAEMDKPHPDTVYINQLRAGIKLLNRRIGRLQGELRNK